MYSLNKIFSKRLKCFCFVVFETFLSLMYLMDSPNITKRLYRLSILHGWRNGFQSGGGGGGRVCTTRDL